MSRDEPAHEGEVSFRPNGAETEVALRMRFEPEGFVEKAGDSLGFVQHRVEDDLDRFKAFIEERPNASGSWRGAV